MRYAGVAAAILMALGLADAAPVTAAALPEPIVWRQNVFSIPYHVHRQPGTEGAPVEVRLFVSDDAGRSWRLAGRSSPAIPSFTFSTTDDGEYWFSLRTVDQNARVTPSGPHQPGLRVIVDTQQPMLNLQAAPSPTGAVEIQWHAVDPNLRLDSLRIEARSGPGATWQPLAIGRPPVDVRGARSGHATWWPQGKIGRVTVRAEVIDHAGNRSISQSEVQLHRPATPNVAATTISNRASRTATSAGAAIAAPPPTTPAGVATRQSWPANQISQAPLGSAPSGIAPPPQPTRPLWRPGTGEASQPVVSQPPLTAVPHSIWPAAPLQQR